MPAPEPRITIRDVTMAYGSFVIQHDLTFNIEPGQIFIIMGGSGCGKSTLLRHLIGLMQPAKGDVLYDGESFWTASPEDRERMMRRFGVLYQSGALWSSMTLAENVALPLGEYTALSAREIREVVALKLALVGLAGFEDFYPAEISGGMRKRAGLARAMALDPDILFFDETWAGLDPLSSRRLDDHIRQLADCLGDTAVVVTHETAGQEEGESMGSKINPTTIGAFVVGAIVLVIAGVLLFGGGKFFQEKVPYVLFFDSSVEGLNVGAPVIFRGVQIGQVKEISAIADPQTFDVQIRVLIELVRGVIKVGMEDQSFHFRDPRQGVEKLIQNGARASLRMQSFVTGLLYVAIDFHPDTPIRLLGLDPKHIELPTIPSDMDQLKSTLQEGLAELKNLPLGAVVAEALTVLQRIKALLELPELKQALVTLHGVMTDARQLLYKADGQVEALGPKLAGTAETASKALETLRVTLLDAQKLVRDVDSQVAPLAGGAKETLTSAKEALTAAVAPWGKRRSPWGH